MDWSKIILHILRISAIVMFVMVLFVFWTKVPDETLKEPEVKNAPTQSNRSP